MINGFLGRINESVHISKHVVLNVQQHTSAEAGSSYTYKCLLLLEHTSILKECV